MARRKENLDRFGMSGQEVLDFIVIDGKTGRQIEEEYQRQQQHLKAEQTKQAKQANMKRIRTPRSR